MINKIHRRRRGVHCFLVPPPLCCVSRLTFTPLLFALASLNLLLPLPLSLLRLPLSLCRSSPVARLPLESRVPLFVLHANLEAHCLAILGELLSRCIISVFACARGFAVPETGNPFVFERRSRRPGVSLSLFDRNYFRDGTV